MLLSPEGMLLIVSEKFEWRPNYIRITTCHEDPCSAMAGVSGVNGVSIIHI